MSLREAAQQALEALHEYVPREDYENKPVGNVIDALRTALSEPEHDTDCHLQGMCQRSGYSIAPDDTALLRQVLEALEAGDWYIDQLEMIVYSADDKGINGERAKVQAAITALRERLEVKA